MTGGVVYGGQGVEVKNSRLTFPSKVACPTCGSAAGDLCVTGDGRPYRAGGAHPSRKRMAARRANETAAEVDTVVLRWTATVTPHERKRLRKALGLGQPALADRLRVKASTLRHWERGTSRPSGPEGTRYGLWLKEAVAAPPPARIEAPPVNLPPERRDVPSVPSRLDVGSHCLNCARWIPGERSYCGRCAAHRGP